MLLSSVINYYSADFVILPRKLGHDTFLILHKIISEAVSILVRPLDFWVCSFQFLWSVCASVLRCCVNGFRPQVSQLCLSPDHWCLCCWIERRTKRDCRSRRWRSSTLGTRLTAQNVLTLCKWWHVVMPQQCPWAITPYRVAWIRAPHNSLRMVQDRGLVS